MYPAQAWGWVLEMYAFTISCHLEDVPPAALHLKMMGQPPWDTQLNGGYYLLHYTYGMDYDKISHSIYLPQPFVPKVSQT